MSEPFRQHTDRCAIVPGSEPSRGTWDARGVEEIYVSTPFEYGYGGAHCRVGTPFTIDAIGRTSLIISFTSARFVLASNPQHEQPRA